MWGVSVRIAAALQRLDEFCRPLEVGFRDASGWRGGRRALPRTSDVHLGAGAARLLGQAFHGSEISGRDRSFPKVETSLGGCRARESGQDAGENFERFIVDRAGETENLKRRGIAERVGMSQMHVSRILRTSLERLRALAVER
jgi:hypothetical protein